MCFLWVGFACPHRPFGRSLGRYVIVGTNVGVLALAAVLIGREAAMDARQQSAKKRQLARAQTAAIAALRQSESRIKAAVEDPDDELHSSAVDLHASASRQHQAVARQLMVAGADISVGQVRSLRTIRERSASSEDPGAEQKATRASRGGWTGAALPPNGQNRAAQPVTPSSKRTSPRISPAP